MRPLPDIADVVVVGGGTAGCVIAGRLAAESDREIVVLESGPLAASEQSNIPGTAAFALGDEVAYLDSTTAQAGLGGRSLGLASGKVLGGGSSVNLLAWFHGHPQDYETWRAAGAAGWGWADVLPVFRRTEHFVWGADEFHGSGGPMVIDFPRDVEPSLMALVAAGQQVGLPVSRDFNGKDRLGVGLSAMNLKDGARHSVVDGYLRPVAGKSNLTVRTGSSVERILIERGRAAGVLLTDGSVVRAREKVVLSAGALRTPKLLMLSGIGPADHLRDHGIDVLVDSPGVGLNLQDHPMMPVVWSVHSGRTLLDSQDERSQESYRLLGRGPLGGLQATAAFLSVADEEAPDVQGLFYLIGMDGNMEPIGEPAVTATIALLTPESRGTVRLASADPAAAPIADPGYLTDSRDLPRLREGLRRFDELMAAPAAREFSGSRIFPPDGTDGGAVDDWIRRNVQTQWHPVGSCRMGIDPAAVVTPDLEVNGVDGLMVADASVMPTITRGNTHAPVVMIGERAADRILG